MSERCKNCWATLSEQTSDLCLACGTPKSELDSPSGFVSSEIEMCLKRADAAMLYAAADVKLGRTRWGNAIEHLEWASKAIQHAIDAEAAKTQNATS